MVTAECANHISLMSQTLDDKCLRIKSSNPFSFRTMSVRVAHAVAVSVSVHALLDKGSTYGTHRRHINDSDLVYNFSNHLMAAKHSILTLLSLKLASFFDETPERRRSPLERTIRFVFKLGDIGLETGVFLGAHRRLYVSGCKEGDRYQIKATSLMTLFNLFRFGHAPDDYVKIF
jgi:hypothetical protein